ncbi:MAG: dipeptide ABC transporter ATP-binding protein [Anaerolineae bacterium]
MGRVMESVLKIENLAIAYETRRGDVKAVRDVSFEIHRGETFGLVGESGCGKSTLAFGVVRYLSPNARVDGGKIFFQGENVLEKTEEQLRAIRGNKMAMVYQDPMSALNPSLRVGDQLAEVLMVHQGFKERGAWQQCLHMLDKVHMPDPTAVMQRYPHQLSGGQQQRVVIAMALLTNPALLIMHEPTTGLDVTIEATILDLIAELSREFDTAILYISHNLGVIARVCERMGVMYAGELMEQAAVDEVFLNSLHPYTQGLLRCIPKLGTSKETSYLYPIPGQVPSLAELPPGCVFEPRCDRAGEECRLSRPDLEEVAAGHFVRCFRWDMPAPSLTVPEGLEKLRFKAVTPGAEEKPLLKVDGLKTYYAQELISLASLIGKEERKYVKAVDDVSFDLHQSHTLGIVGESGCGKSTLARTIVGLEALTGGGMEFMETDISRAVEKRDRGLLKELQMVFQNPDSTLNPSFTAGQAISRPLRRFGTVPRSQVREEVIRLLNAVKLGPRYYDRLPRQLSGGEKQRVAIARAFAGRPELVLCDEPVSSLDVSVQAAVLNLLLEFQQTYGTTMVFISHDLSVVRYFSDYVAVMYLGQLCEIGPTEALFMPPYHPYTEALLSAVPVPDPSIEQKRIRLDGPVPSALNPPSGCRFHTRCPRKIGEICETTVPPWQSASAEHRIFCHIPLAELRTVEPVVHTVDHP